jgi:hypothetical protein
MEFSKEGDWARAQEIEEEQVRSTSLAFTLTTGD